MHEQHQIVMTGMPGAPGSILNLGLLTLPCSLPFLSARFWPAPALALNDKLHMPTSAQSVLGIAMFALLGASLSYSACKELDQA